VRQLYLAATGQNRGKTTAALGLFDGFLRAGLRTAFMKPVGQRTVIDHGQPADEDAVLMHEVFPLAADYGAMSPVHIPRGFTK
jgi:phosphate acetyltransferase